MANKAFEALMRLIGSIVKAPIKRFWKSFEESCAERDYLHIVMSLIVSLICLAGIGFLFVIIAVKATEIILSNPFPFAVIATIVALYFHVADEKKDKSKADVITSIIRISSYG